MRLDPQTGLYSVEAGQRLTHWVCSGLGRGVVVEVPLASELPLVVVLRAPAVVVLAVVAAELVDVLKRFGLFPVGFCPGLNGLLSSLLGLFPVGFCPGLNGLLSTLFGLFPVGLCPGLNGLLSTLFQPNESLPQPTDESGPTAGESSLSNAMLESKGSI